MDAGKVFDLGILTVGVVESYRKQYPQGFRPESMGTVLDVQGMYQLGNRDLVVKSNGKVYISTNVLTALVGGGDRRQFQMTLGRIHLFEWSQELADDCLRHATYEARNEREQWVRDRNLNILTWLDEFCKPGGPSSYKQPEVAVRLLGYPPLDTSNVPVPQMLCWCDADVEYAKRNGMTPKRMF